MGSRVIPANRLSTDPYPAAYLSPDDVTPPNALTDYELGGIALSDPSQGLRVQTWTATWNSGDGGVYADSPATSPALVFTPGSGLSWLSLAFDQNMRPVIAYTQAGAAKMRWYDSEIAGYTTTTFPVGTSDPCVCMDDKRQSQTSGGANDVIVGYIRAGSLYFRAQRDRYGVEYLLASDLGAVKVRRIGMNEVNRLQFRLGK
jgi:hypothetical protein